MTKPKLRNVSLQQATINGDPFLILKDPECFAKQPLLIPHNDAMLYILGRFDGERDIPDIQEDFMRTFGVLIMSDQIRDIIDALDENHFLDNEEFQRYKKGVMNDFLKSPLRPSSLAGASYPREKLEVEKLLQAMLDQARYRENAGMNASTQPCALIAPHIDFIRGGSVYGAIYNALPVKPPPDLFIILGTAHSPCPSFFIPTRKSFETPLGIAKTSTRVLDEMERELSSDLSYQDEFIHSGEHSIEFQVLWLQYLFRGGDSLRILPILCGSIDPFMERGIEPVQDEQYAFFLDCLVKSIEKTGQKPFIIAGADLSHVGASFGDAFPEGIPDAFLEETKRHDQWVLESVKSLDFSQFFDRIASCDNRYRICGLAPVYAMLYLLKALGKDRDGMKGYMVDYDQSLDSERTTSVSFTGMIFY